MRCLMHNRYSDQFGSRMFVKNKALFEVAGPSCTTELRVTPWQGPYPDSLNIAAQPIVASPIEIANKRKRFDDLFPAFMAANNQQSIDCLLVVRLDREPFEEPKDTARSTTLVSKGRSLRVPVGAQLRSPGNTGIGMNSTPSSTRPRASSGVASP